MIKISVPNDDHVALRAMAKALEEIAVARGAPLQSVDVTHSVAFSNTMSDEAIKRLQRATQDLMQAAPAMLQENNVDGSIEIHGKRKTFEERKELLAKALEQETPDSLFEKLQSYGTPCATDSTGTPWDERIHSASKALNADGTWRLRRKPKDMDETEWSQFVDATLIEIMPNDKTNDIGEVVEQSIRAAHHAVAEQYGQGLANAAFTGDRNKSPEPTVTPEGDDFHVDAGVVTEQQVASFPPPPPVPQVLTPVQEAKVAEVVAQATMTFPQVMQFLTERHGRITSAQVDDIIADMGLNSIMDLNTQPEHTGPFIARVKALLGE